MKAVFHLDLDDEKILRIALSNVENLYKANPAAQAALLVNGPAVQLFRQDALQEHQDRLRSLLQAGVTISLCRNALRTFDIAETDICSGCQIVPAGIVALIEWQSQGWAYIKP